MKTVEGLFGGENLYLLEWKNGNPIGTINPLVDIYNSISLRYGLPCGGEDIDTFVGDLRLTRADGNEPFLPLGADENASPYEEEIELIDETRSDEFQMALQELSDLVSQHLGGSVKIEVLDSNNREITILG